VLQIGLPIELFLGILSTSSGSAPVDFQACHPNKVAVRPRCPASVAAYRPFGLSLMLPRNLTTVPSQRCEMKNPTGAAVLHNKLGAPSSETLESLRLLKAFLRLAPSQRFEVIELVERLATDPAAASDHPLS
jgi:hypothetical protein